MGGVGMGLRDVWGAPCQWHSTAAVSVSHGCPWGPVPDVGVCPPCGWVGLAAFGDEGEWRIRASHLSWPGDGDQPGHPTVSPGTQCCPSPRTDLTGRGEGSCIAQP